MSKNDTINDPQQLQAQLNQGKFVSLEGLAGYEQSGLQGRAYANYEDYLLLQASKLELEPEMVQKYSDILRQALPARIKATQHVTTGTRVLCLGARLGHEVEAFIEQGAVAIGIDLNPGQMNKYVVFGDFHQLQFANASFDLVFTNCFDHMLEPFTVLAEIQRVLRPDGRFMLEINNGTKDTPRHLPDHWDCLSWEHVAAPLALIEKAGFALQHLSPITQPWAGQSAVFALNIKPTTLNSF